MNKLIVILEGYVNKIDIYFLEKNEQERLILKLVLPFMFLALSYFVLIPDTEAMLVESKQRQESLNSQKIDTETKINQIVASQKIENLQKDIKNIQDGIEAQFDFQDNIAGKLSNMRASQHEWQYLLNEISMSARRNRLHVEIIDSSLNDGNINYQESRVVIGGAGSFYEIMNFLNEIELLGIYVHISKVKLASDKAIKFEATIAARTLNL